MDSPKYHIYVNRLILVIMKFAAYYPVADPGKNLTGAPHSNFGRGGCGRRGEQGSWIYAMMLLSKPNDFNF